MITENIKERKMEKKLSEVLEEMKTDYFKNVPEEAADMLIRKFIWTLVQR